MGFSGFFLLLACMPIALAADPVPPLDVVVDLDQTLIYDFAQEPRVKDARTFTVLGKWYRFSDGAEEFLEKVLALPGARVSFFSGGGAERNRLVLEKLKLADGRSALDVAYKNFDRDELTDLGDFTLPRPQQRRKDIAKVSGELRRTVLVDDHEWFAMPSQRRNTVWLGKVYNYIDDYPAWIRAGNVPGPNDPPTEAEWRRERRKLGDAYERIARAYRETASNPYAFLETLARDAPPMPAAQECYAGYGDLFRGLMTSLVH